MYQQLQTQLDKYLREAKHVYIATALIKNYGYKFIYQRLPDDAKCYYLIGLNLPSDAEVFERMLNVPLEKGYTRIFVEDQTFHPKVYLIERICGNWIAFIGSANTTNGGLIGNVEMSIATEDQATCINLLNWFTDLSTNACELTPEFVREWRRTTSRIRQRQSANSADVIDVRSLLKSKSEITTHQIKISEGQFFKTNHYEAFSEPFWTDKSLKANAERKKVWLRLAELDSRIYPLFDGYQFKELSSHYWKQSRISHYQHRKGFNNTYLRSIWLHYGYPDRAIQKDFVKHPRMQVILHQNNLGIWLVLGTPNSSIRERERFKKNLVEHPTFADLVYQVIANIGGIYSIRMNGKPPIHLSKFDSADKLAKALLSEELHQYLIFGREYHPDSPDLSDANIAETILMEFQRLHPLYLLYKNGQL